MVGDARIVGLGEATHGTRDFFLLKHRMVRFLVEELGFTHFAIEAGFAECLAIDRYVRTGQGDPAKALAGLGLWVWNTQEVLALIEWMRAYNADPARGSPVRFLGFDMRSPAGSASQLLSYLEDVDTEFAAGEWDLTEEVRAFLETAAELPLGPVSAELRDRSRVIVEILRGRFDELEQVYVERSSAEEAAFGRRLVVVMAQAIQVAPAPDGSPPPLSARDRCMAENTSWLLEHAGDRGKVVIWAHNGHISRNGLNRLESQGGFLHAQHGADYRAFGFSFSQGGFQAMNGGAVGAFEVGPHGEDSFDAVLASAGHRRAFFDIRGAEPGSPVHAWLHAPQKIRTVGAFYSDAMEQQGRGAMLAEPAGAFDVWIFADRTERARPLGVLGSPGASGAADRSERQGL